MTTVVDLSVVESVVEITVNEATTVELEVVSTAVEITGVEAAGPRGPQGELGPTGLSAYEVALLEGFVGTEAEWLESLVGPPGPSGGSYTHVQNGTSDTWVIAHDLGFAPAITVVDSGGTVVIGEVTHDSVSQATVRFASAFSGRAYAS